MGRLIDTSDLNNQIMLAKSEWGVMTTPLSNIFEEIIMNTPTAEPKTGHTGHWIYICNSEVNGLKIVKCSECGKRTYGSGKYCPNCGAKMEDQE